MVGLSDNASLALFIVLCVAVSGFGLWVFFRSDSSRGAEAVWEWWARGGGGRSRTSLLLFSLAMLFLAVICTWALFFPEHR